MKTVQDVANENMPEQTLLSPHNIENCESARLTMRDFAGNEYDKG
jgi:hypothetical protein